MEKILPLCSELCVTELGQVTHLFLTDLNKVIKEDIAFIYFYLYTYIFKKLSRILLSLWELTATCLLIFFLLALSYKKNIYLFFFVTARPHNSQTPSQDRLNKLEKQLKEGRERKRK